jgi:hypothetical protein
MFDRARLDSGNECRRNGKRLVWRYVLAGDSLRNWQRGIEMVKRHALVRLTV